MNYAGLILNISYGFHLKLPLDLAGVDEHNN